MKVSCFLPCRRGSERVLNKNIGPFAGFQHGLIEIKLRQLCRAELIDEIVLSTNDDEIIRYATSLGHPKIRLHKREESLSSSETSTDSLAAHALFLIPTGHILWTHVTSPFVKAKEYDLIIQSYVNALADGYDSLMTTTEIHGFLWDKKGPVNYDRNFEKWPRTQTLASLHEVNSAAFLSSADNYEKLDDRIGEKPFLYTLDKIKSFDIDWPDDFKIAECIVKGGLVEL
jgi:CMP-N-acetylneuraminic acid synthetase